MNDVGNVDFEKCVIICHNLTKEATTSTDVGRTRIKEQSLRRDDVVRKRLKLLGEDNEDWLYHSSNECYMRCTNMRVSNQ